MAQFLDIEQSLLLLELEPPFEKRDVQLARRRQAKIWHPDIAPPGKQFEHERHLKASAAAARAPRAGEGQRAYEAARNAAAAEKDRKRHDPFAGQVPDHSVVHRYARCLSYPEWGVGSVTGVYFTGDGDDIQQWAR